MHCMSEHRLAWPEPGIAVLTLSRPRQLNALTDDAGLGLALACEIRLAGAAAAFNAAFVKVGMSSCDIGVSWLLPRCVGMSRAFEIMLTGRMVAADEAERIGLVSATMPDADLLRRALDLENRTQILARTTGHLQQAAQALVGRRSPKPG